MVAPKAPSRKADEVSRELLSRIVGGELAPDSLLPKEEELEAEFGVARSVVREAVKILEVHKLVRPIRRRGTIVLDPRASLSPDVVAAFLTPREGKTSPDFLRGFLEIRRALDMEMCGLAAERRRPHDVGAMRVAADAFRNVASEPEEIEGVSLAFGLAIARASQNPLFVMFVHWSAATVRELSPLFAEVNATEGSHGEGVEHILGAIERGDAAEARRASALYHDWVAPKILAASAAK